MAIFTGQTGSVAISADAGEPTRDYSSTIGNWPEVTRWKLSSTRGPRDVTPKAHPQFIGVPSEVQWMADIEGMAMTSASRFEPVEWFNAQPLILTLYRLDLGDYVRGAGWTESLVHEVIVDGPIRWRARLRMIGDITLV